MEGAYVLPKLLGSQEDTESYRNAHAQCPLFATERGLESTIAPRRVYRHAESLLTPFLSQGRGFFLEWKNLDFGNFRSCFPGGIGIEEVPGVFHWGMKWGTG